MGEDAHMGILSEAGEAIGNVGRRLFRRKRTRQAEEAVQRWMERVPAPHLQESSGQRGRPDEGVIDGTCRVIEDDEEQKGAKGA
jgi:hypothetical protein